MQNSRTANTAKNATFGLVTQGISILLGFVSRTAFIHILGVEYLGVNGLFTNILMLLSFAELGIGNAIIYGMYKPLANDDREKIKSLMALYKKAYRFIGLFILVFGAMVIPFLNIIIEDTPNISENIVVIYLLFLLNTSISYFYVYKKSIIIADQKNYIVLFYQQIFKIVQTILQIAFLWFTRAYLIYLIIQIIVTLFNNIVVSKKADSLYPYLLEKKVRNLDKAEFKTIFQNVKAMFLYKFGSVILNGTDNIIISMIIGLTAVGINSNYVLIITAVSSILGQVMNGFTASVGNLNAVGKTEDKERIFNKIFFLSAWIYGFCAVGLFLFINKLIVFWVGETFIFSSVTVFAIVLHFYINSVHFAAYTYRITMGLFVKGKWTPLAAAILNIALSFTLGHRYGIAGIFFATSISRFITTGIVDPVLVYKNGFNKNPILYYIKYFMYVILFILLYFGMDYMISFNPIQGFRGFVVDIIMVSIMFNFMMAVIFWKNHNFVELRKTFTDLVKNILNKRKNS